MSDFNRSYVFSIYSSHAYIVNNIGGYHYGGWVPLVERLPTGQYVYQGIAPLIGADY